MKFFLDNWFLFLVAFLSGGALLWPLISRSAQGRGVTPTQAVLLINRDKAVVVDVSEPHEFAQGHVKGARHIPFGQLEGSKDLPTNKALPIILVCPSGVRAARAVATLRKLGYENAVSVAGGLGAWREANLPVEKSAA